MWPFKKDPGEDPQSLGNMVVEKGHCAKEDVAKALAFQTSNPDVMLGEALVRMGLLEREQLEVVLAHQQIRKSNGRQKGESIRKLADIATARLDRISDRVEDAVLTDCLEKKSC